MWKTANFGLFLLCSIHISILKHQMHLKCLNLRLLQHFNTLSCTAKTDLFPSYSDPICSVLWQCCFVLRTNYCLSCVLRALCFSSCHSLTCGRKGHVFFRVCQWPLSMLLICIGPSLEEKDKKSTRKYANTFRSIMLRQFFWVGGLPLSLVGLFFTSCSLILSSQSRTTIFGHTSVPPVILRDKAVFVQTRVSSVSPSAQPVGQYKWKPITQSYHITAPRMKNKHFPIPNTISW